MPLQQPTTSEVEGNLKPNLFALPSQTTIFFGLIVVVLLGTLVIGSLDTSPIPIWPLTLVLVFLSFRAFLAASERHIIQHKLLSVGDKFYELEQTINSLAQKQQLSLPRLPKLLVTQEKTGLHTFGTVRHQYIAVSYEEAQRLQEYLHDPVKKDIAEAKLIHELYHFKTGDYWQMSYGQELLRLTFTIIGWAIIFLTGYGFSLIVVGSHILQFSPSELTEPFAEFDPELRDLIITMFPSDEEMAAVREKASEINLMLVLDFVYAAFLPFLFVGGILWLFFWPKFWRLRDLYADAGVAHTQGEISPLLANLGSVTMLSYLRRYPGVIQNIKASTPNAQSFVKKWWHRILHPREYHYQSVLRIRCIADPWLVFGTWSDAAILLGTLTLLLDILLVSPLTLLQIGQWPMHFTTLVVFAVVSLNLIPVLVRGNSGWSYMLKTIAVVIGLRFIWLIITLGLLISLFVLAPDALNNILIGGVAATARFAGYSDHLAYDDLGEFIIQASVLNLAQVFIVFFVLLAALAVMILILRSMFSWYSLPHANVRLMRYAYLVVGSGTICLATLILPFITSFLLEIERLKSPLVILGMFFGVLVLVGTFFWFFRMHYRYQRCCPNCGVIISMPYKLGKRCPSKTCNELLHPWLVAEY